MYKIEKFLIEHKFKKSKEYDSGVVVYTNIDDEPPYVIDVAIWTDACKRHQRVWEATVYNPYGVTLSSYTKYDKDDEEACKDTNRALSDDHVECAFRFLEWLQEVENPWEIIE